MPHSCSSLHLICMTWNEREYETNVAKKKKKKDTDKSQSVVSEAVAVVVFERNLIGETNFGLNWWNNARRICTEIAFHVRISAKPLRSTITRLRCKEAKKSSQSEEHKMEVENAHAQSHEYNNKSGVGNFLELSEIVSIHTNTNTYNTIGNQILFIRPEQKGQIKMKHERWLYAGVLGHKCFVQREAANWLSALYSTVRYRYGLARFSTVQFEFNLARVDLVRFNGKIIHVFISTQWNCLVSLSYIRSDKP